MAVRHGKAFLRWLRCAHHVQCLQLHALPPRGTHLGWAGTVFHAIRRSAKSRGSAQHLQPRVIGACLICCMGQRALVLPLQ